MSNQPSVARLVPIARNQTNAIGNTNSVAGKAADTKLPRKNADKNSWMLTLLIVTTSISLAMLVTIIIVIAIDPFPLAKSWSIGINLLTYGRSKGKNSVQDDPTAVVRIFPGSSTIQKAYQSLRNETLRALVDYYAVHTSSREPKEGSSKSDLSVPSHLVWHVRRYYKDVDQEADFGRKRQKKKNSLTEENTQHLDPRLTFLKSLIDKLDHLETRKSTRHNDNAEKLLEPTGERIPLGKRSAIYISQRIIGCRVEILPPNFRSYYRSNYAGLMQYCLPLLIPSRQIASGANRSQPEYSNNNNNKDGSKDRGHCTVYTQKKSYEIKENRAFVFDSSHSQWDLENSHERLPCILLWIDVARPLPGILAMTNRFLTKNLSRSRLADVYFGERKLVASSSSTASPLPNHKSLRENKKSGARGKI